MFLIWYDVVVVVYMMLIGLIWIIVVLVSVDGIGNSELSSGNDGISGFCE